MENPLEYLSQIKHVEAPPYLYTRIQQRISAGSEIRITSRMTWSYTLSFIAILAINTFVIYQQLSARDLMISFQEDMHLVTKNALYE